MHTTLSLNDVRALRDELDAELGEELLRAAWLRAELRALSRPEAKPVVGWAQLTTLVVILAGALAWAIR